MTETIGRVLSAAADSAPAEAWEHATARITSERSDVERMLRTEPRPRVYGFNTLLGHLDTVAAVETNQLVLHQAHLIGRTTSITGTLPDLILATKLEQLSHGGSGLHPHTYRVVLGSFAGPAAEVRGAWRASYSSGDVVPAAWWIQHLRDTNPALRFRSGDLIALLNGNFVSTAFALHAVVQLVEYLADFIVRTVEIAQPGRVAAVAAGRDWLADEVRADLPRDSGLPSVGDHVQPAVSVRDLATYLAPISTTIDALRTAIDARLSTFSGNPTFRYVGREIRHTSSASFLDLNLSLALTSGIQLTHFCMAAIQRFTQHLCDTQAQLPAMDYMHFVQPPKVSSAMVVEAGAKHGTLPSRFQLAESEGIEDQADLSLSIAQSLAEVLRLANDQLAVLDNVAAMMRRRTRPSRTRYHRVLLGRFAGSAYAARRTDQRSRISRPGAAGG